MVERQTWGLIGFISSFFSVYLASLTYSIFPTIFNINMTENPTWNSYISSANTTIAGNATIASWLPVVGIVLAAGVVISVLIGAFSFEQVMKKN